jgi:hypothetical protein
MKTSLGWPLAGFLVGAMCFVGLSHPVAAEWPPAGPEFQVNTYTTSHQKHPTVAVDTDGDFVVVWQSYCSSGTDTDSYSIQAQRYASDGSAVGSEFQVNTYTTSYLDSPAVAADTDGDFVVVWYSDGSSGTDTDRHSIQAQRYASDGTPAGSEFQVNTYTTSYQRFPAVATDTDGDFVVVWQSYGSSGTDTDRRSIQAQRFASDGSALGSEFQVNTYTTLWQFDPSVAVDADGEFVVVWKSYGSSGTDTDGFSIQAQQYLFSVFADGFESGDTTLWSSTVP